MYWSSRSGLSRSATVIFSNYSSVWIILAILKHLLTVRNMELLQWWQFIAYHITHRLESACRDCKLVNLHRLSKHQPQIKVVFTEMVVWYWNSPGFYVPLYIWLLACLEVPLCNNFQRAAVDAYFEAQLDPAMTSDRTLSRLGTPQMDHATLAAKLADCQLPYSKETEILYQEHKANFNRWMFLLW